MIQIIFIVAVLATLGCNHEPKATVVVKQAEETAPLSKILRAPLERPQPQASVQQDRSHGH